MIYIIKFQYPHHATTTKVYLIYLIFMSLMVFYFLHSTSVLSFYIDVVLTLSIQLVGQIIVFGAYQRKQIYPSQTVYAVKQGGFLSKLKQGCVLDGKRDKCDVCSHCLSQPQKTLQVLSRKRQDYVYGKDHTRVLGQSKVLFETW